MSEMRGCLVAIALLAAWPVLAEEPARFLFFKDLQGPWKQDEIVSVLLDSDVFAAAKDRFPDLRIFDQDGAEAPFLVEKASTTRTETSRAWHRANVVSLQETGANRVEIRLALEEKSPPADGLRIHTPLRDFERRVQVYGSSDGKAWTPLVKDAVLCDYSRYMDVSNREVPLPANRHRQLKLVVDEITETRDSPFMELTRKSRGGKEEERVERSAIQRVPLRIDRIDAWETLRRELRGVEQTSEYPVVRFTAEEDARNKRTIVDLENRREPLTSLTLQTSSRNFSRRASVQVPVVEGVRTDWVELGAATIHVLRLGQFHREQLTVTFPERRSEKYRIVVDNEDNPPLTITGVKAQGNAYRLVFLAQEGKTYRLYYGSESVEQPRYDVGNVLGPLRSGSQSAPLQLGPQQPNPAVQGPGGATLRNLLNNKAFLLSAIVLMVAVLGWGLLRTGRRIGQMPNE